MMTIRPAAVAALYGGLCLAIGAECLAGVGAAPATLPLSGAHVAAAAAPAGLQAAALAEAVLARPLFAVSRRPPEPPVLAKAAAPGPIPPPQARLAGTITTAETHVAFFDQPGMKPQSLGVGGQLGAWRVVAIYSGRVTLRAEDGSLLSKTMTGTTTPIVVSALRNWKPPVFHHEE